MSKKVPDAATIAEIGLKYHEIGNAEIIRLFGVSRHTASIMKKPVHEKMAERGVQTWSPRNVNTRIAFEVWGLDLEASVRALQQLRRLGFEQ